MKLRDGELNIPVPDGWLLVHDEPQFRITVSYGSTSVAFDYAFYSPTTGTSVSTASLSTTLPYLKRARVTGNQYGNRYNRLWKPERALLALAVGRVLR